ncbi:hypothetical protein TWF569_009883 [Orbilia oligospora]|uniref:Nuclear fusion protein KAR5 n=1 Tax=Orbilia oligospora TaxID=2813651 RepID=A0A7C8JM55_ORBOL|nr:hypothetical protein TWF706_005647 [Orbilia oligospora]KAF3132498.1 hypothetical protein TWF703_007294 [Orbilia oligospora]KAF3135542.1 hypothetical protein TWF569_009883 [Orbilia oligospora]KAF3142579.1 hypothetical protein TWF594_005468 [Orbilia oligospora]
MALLNLAALLWVLWIIGSFPQMVEASAVISSMASESNGNEAIQSLENLISSHKLHKGYEDSLALINSLNLPHSCLYSSLTESIIEKCSVSPTVLDGEEKNFFATKLAICELSSANVDYPRECRGNIQSSKELNKCIKRLETRAQWWTSWSNCIQSVGVLCQAVREEAQRDSLLRLHRNLTVLHHQLENRLVTSLDFQTSAIKQASQSSNMINQRVAILISEMDTLLNHTIVPMNSHLKSIKAVMANIDRLQVAQAAHLAEQGAVLDEHARAQRETMHRIDTIVRQVIEAVETYESLVERKNEADDEVRRKSLLEMSSAIAATTGETIDAIKATMKVLNDLGSETGMKVSGLVDKITEGHTQLSNLAENYDSLATSHERISRSMLEQEETATRQLETVVHQATVFNNTFLNAIAESTGYLQKLSELRKNSLYGMSAVPGLGLVSTYLPVLVSILVVLDRKRTAIAVIFFATLYIFFMTYPFETAPESNDSAGETMNKEGLLLDAGNDKYRWFQGYATEMIGYFRAFW